MTFKEAQEKLIAFGHTYGIELTSLRYEVTRHTHWDSEPSYRFECSLYADGFRYHTAPTWEEAFGMLTRYVEAQGIQPVNPITVGTQAPE
jgi:hypothetical protein